RAEVNVGVGVRRTIVKNELLGFRSRSSNQLIEIHLRPFFQASRLVLGQVGFLSKACLWQVDRLLQIKCGFSGRHSVSSGTEIVPNNSFKERIRSWVFGSVLSSLYLVLCT